MYHIYGLNVTLAGGLHMGIKHIVLPAFKQAEDLAAGIDEGQKYEDYDLNKHTFSCVDIVDMVDINSVSGQISMCH